MNKVKWQYETGDGAISEIDSDSVVFYKDDIASEVIAAVVDMWNTTELSPKDIVKTIAKDHADIVNDDELDYIQEQISAYVALTAGKEPVSQAPEGTYKASVDPVVTDGTIASVTITKEEPVEDKPVKKTRQPRTTTGTTSAQSPEDYIKSLQEKITLATALNEITLPEIPTGISKSGRDILVNLHKEHATLIANCIQQIQQM